MSSHPPADEFLPPQCTALTSPTLSHFPESTLFPHPAALPTSSCTLTCTPILSWPSPIDLLQPFFLLSFPLGSRGLTPGSHHPPPNPLHTWHTLSLGFLEVEPSMGEGGGPSLRTLLILLLFLSSPPSPVTFLKCLLGILIYMRGWGTGGCPWGYGDKT